MKRITIISLLFTFALQAVFAQRQKVYKEERIDVSIGSVWELAPAFYRDGIAFVSNKGFSGITKNEDDEGRPLSDIYYSEVKIEASNGSVSYEREELLSQLFTSVSHDGPICFARKDRMACFVMQYYYAEKDNPSIENNNNAGLYFAYYQDDEWTDVTRFEHCNTDITYNTPCLSEDGETLYFAAELEDSYGGLDIYVSYFENGSWTEPQNLGPQVNTAAVDFYPFIHSTGRLYFSSEGHNSDGDKDIWYCDNYEGQWSNAVPLGIPFNDFRPVDDYAFIISEDFSYGYFTTKRRGGQADIYRFESTIEPFEFPRPIQRNKFCFRLRENSLDTIDYELFDYEWNINDTVFIPGHDIQFCFPGPGDYNISFNVHDKMLDTTMYGVASLFFQLKLVEQPVITAPDTVYVNQAFRLSAEDTYLPRYEIGEYYWDLGYGVWKEGEVITHTFTVPGTQTVVLGLVEKRRNEPEKFAVYKDIVVLPAE